MNDLSTADRDRLRAALVELHPWLRATDLGPATVDAGECDRCGDEARLVETCGPVPWRRLGRSCAEDVGTDAWCDGHLDEAEAALEWLAELPDDADDVARLWWVATGEVRLGSLASLSSLAEVVLAPGAGPGLELDG